MTRNGTLQTIYMDKELLSKIHHEIIKIGHGVKISGWICQACIDKLNNGNCLKEVLFKLKEWNKSFPKKPIKELIDEIEEKYNAKV